MSQVFAGQDPASYASVARSVRLAGHATSIRLEATFWDLLDEIAARQGASTPCFLSTLYDEVVARNGQVTNFTSLLRAACVLYLRRPEVAAGLAEPALETVAAE